MKRLVWKEGDILNIRLDENSYTLAQMLRDPYIKYFIISSEDGKWENVDLDDVDEFFIVRALHQVVKKLAVAKVRKGVKPATDSTVPIVWIRPWPNKRRCDLIEFDPELGDRGFQNKVLIRNIAEDDKETLVNHDLSIIYGMESLVERLTMCLKLKRNVDPIKQAKFPNADFLK